MGDQHRPGDATSEHPLEGQPEAVDEAQENATEEHERSEGDAREPYAGTSPDPQKAWDRATKPD